MCIGLAGMQVQCALNEIYWFRQRLNAIVQLCNCAIAICNYSVWSTTTNNL